MGIFVVMAHYDPRGVVAPHVRRNVEALAALAQRLVVVSTADLDAENEKWLRERATVIRRENYGYDFFSFRAGLLADGGLDALAEYDNVIMCNDSFVGPVGGFDAVTQTMSTRPFDVWGFTMSTEITRHVQSFFVSFAPWVVRSQAFRQFWLRMTPLSDRSQVILNYEIGLTRALDGAGFAIGSYFTKNAEDERMSRWRAHWFVQARTRRSSVPARLRALRRPVSVDWNPSIAMADRVLDAGRLPIVKIDTLRYDPWGLDSDRLLRECEAAYPDQFAGVRDYLAETATFYPPRPENTLPPLTPAQRPLRPLVRYASGR